MARIRPSETTVVELTQNEMRLILEALAGHEDCYGTFQDDHDARLLLTELTEVSE